MPQYLQTIGEVNRPVAWGKNDIEIYLRWREAHNMHGKMGLFNYRLSAIESKPKGMDEFTEKCWMALCQRRIDLVVVNDHLWDIYEFRHNSQPSAVGRLLMYAILWNSEEKKRQLGRVVLVSNHIPADMRLLAEAYKVTMIEE